MENKILKYLDLTGVALAVMALLGALTSSVSSAPIQINDQAQCVYAVTPSSLTATQFNTTTTLATGGGSCNYYSNLCAGFETAYSTNTVYLSSSSNKADAVGWPIFGNTTQCKSWGPNVKVFYSLKDGAVPETNSLKFQLSR